MDKRLVFILLVLVSCSPFSDYSKKEDGLYIKLCSFEDGEKSFRPSFYKEVSITIKSGEELIFRNFKEQLISAEDKRLNFLFEHLNEGDSAQFKISAALLSRKLPTIKTTKGDEYYDAQVKVHHYYQHQPKVVDPEMQEQIILNKFLKENKQVLRKSGVFVEQTKKGKGESIVRDKIVTIHYIGRFLNQLEFDNSYRNSAFTFTYGTPGQVIPGLEIALKGMKAGEKAKIIIPSQLAFQDEGSSTKVVPPFSTVIYELEIVNVK